MKTVLKRILLVLLIAAIVIAAIFVCIGFVTTKQVKDPAISDFETELRADFPEVRSVRVTVSRPTACVDIHMKGDENLDRIAAASTQWVCAGTLYEDALRPNFRLPHIWARIISVRLYVGGELIREYSSGSLGTELGSLRSTDFSRWDLLYDKFNTDNVPVRDVFVYPN